MVEVSEEYNSDGLIVDLSTIKLEEELQDQIYGVIFTRRIRLPEYKDPENPDLGYVVDTRRKIEKEKYKLPPYANILRIQSTYKDNTNGYEQKFNGSGVLVGPKHILTAYSNIHQKNLGDALSVEISSHLANINAKMVDNLNFGVNDTEEGLKYFNNADLALLVLDKPLGLTLGYVPMVPVKTIKPLVEVLHVAGHSSMDSFSPVLWVNEGKCKDPKRSLETGIAEYEIKIDKEMIGCPIYVEIIGIDKKTSYYVIGIQSLVEFKGIILTEERLSKIKNKISETK